MPVPDATSAEGLDRYSAGTRIGGSKGEAWRDIRLSIFALPPVMDVFTMPSVNEPFIAWTTSGDIEMQERENNGPWLTSRVRAGSMFLTAAGAPYDLRWKALSPAPFEAVLVTLSVPLFNVALEEVFGDDAQHARLRDVSAFADPRLTTLLEQLKEETKRPTASALLVRGLAQALAVHVAREYTVLTEASRSESSSLPGFKLRRITDWMNEHLAEEFSLSRLAEQVGMSEFHFNRLFKRATGVPPSQYQIKLRLDAARRLLRESTKSVITIANEVGYSNPSHFAQIFRKETGLSPTDYRRQR